MGLRDIVILTKTIPAGDTTFEVRGLSAHDLIIAASDFGPQLTIVFTKLKSGEIVADDLKSAVMSVSKEFPELLAALICLAADDYDPVMVNKMKKVPIGVTTEAVEAIFGLTFRGEAEVKKLMESLARMIAAGSEALTTALGPTSGIGTGAPVAH